MSELVNNGHFNQPQQQRCKECGLILNSAESLSVHMQYSHNEDMLAKWNSQNIKSEENNNSKSILKREFPITNSSSSEHSDSHSKSDNEYSRTSPEHVYGHPPTPQSNHSSPYQNNENPAYSPNFQSYQNQIKVEQLSPNNQYHYPPIMNDHQPFYSIHNVDQNLGYDQEYPVHQSLNNFRYHPYHSRYPQTLSSSLSQSGHIYPPQPTPSPSPKTCDKCGFICNSASQLLDHISASHPPTPVSQLGYQITKSQNQHYIFCNDGQSLSSQVKTEEPSDILDLDSHQVFSKEEKFENSNHGPQVSPQLQHNISSLVNNWPPQGPQPNMPPSMQDRMSLNNEQLRRLGQSTIVQPGPVSGSGQELMSSNGNNGALRLSPTNNFGNFDHLPPNNSVIPSVPQAPNGPTAAPSAPTKSANWKSNEARRPKTYNCTACNKWFTSSGHLKRHYNTTLHKNAVKTSGQKDPALQPISTHHHPTRENASSRDDNNSDSQNGEPRLEDGNSLPPQFEMPTSMPGHLQQPPNGPYDRQQPPNMPMISNGILHSPTLVSSLLSLNNVTNANSPNGEAGSSTMNLETRGLLPMMPSNTQNMPPGFSMVPQLMPMETNPYQMYPNEEAPHVLQEDIAINNLSISGEEFINTSFNRNSQQVVLPSFDEIQLSSRFGNRNYDDANVGGGVSATDPFVYLSDTYIIDNKENEDSDELSRNADGSIYVYSDALYLAPDGQYQDLANNNNNNNILGETRWWNNNTTMNQEHDPSMNSNEPLVTEPPPEVRPQPVFECVACSKTFNKACYLTQHNKNSHSGVKPFKCSRCGKRYHNKEMYETHLSKHGNNKPYKCTECSKMFNHKTDLRRHMFCHNGVKPHFCQTCKKGFIRKDHMLKHVETHKKREKLKGSSEPRSKRKT